ncbi:MAG TPA: response regulator transcription factor [Anaerolineales bacterium]|nr:response regulator transcription factor [Anaerolineales bacterium]
MKDNEKLILIVDDEPLQLKAAQIMLQEAGFRVLTAVNGAQGLKLALENYPDLVMLDWMMPDMDGLEVCQRLRELSSVPIIMITALSSEKNKIAGLEAGADDYITKPFGRGELLARVNAVLRRANASPHASDNQILVLDALHVDFSNRRIWLNGHEVHLSPTEFSLLRELARQPGKVVSNETLLKCVWGTDYVGDTSLVRKVVHRLRQKIELDPQDPQYVLSQPGFGYYLGAK